MKPQEEQSAAADAARMREWMSALADGQADAAAQACAQWAADPQARQAWHEYHLVGDVLRSDDLASTAVRDEAFLLALRQRLASEPVILAPQPVVAGAGSSTTGTSRRWAVAAAAAGFMLVGGAVVMLQRSDSAPPLAAVTPVPMVAGGEQATRPPSGSAPRVVSLPASSALGDPQWRVVDGNLIRDARLDAYLRAHRGLDAARPGAVAGRFETVVLER